ncbi:type VII secretion target [Mycobacterium shimoidei]|uniref:type VII secretion target n=1 Tax=Mycobacterium shimoidei TaxID=29313 RepID=UPI000848A6D1|nr:type VII secretion target [Mycobacterium shimoidei]MCV7259903.1 ESX-1 secretion-associated protein [Mycobacterium shimoidei]ODR15051.1 hypothetical protein BHQ16_03205 [Mycobacterium shimoidei]ORW79216.1 hypothetical protein AWC26_16620 [Mycobacterium shimoidei]
MSQDNLFTQTDGLRSFAQSHADVVSGLTGLLNTAAEASGVQTTHGPIASAVHTALSSALSARQGSMQNVVNIGRNLTESLQAAAHTYEQVDQRYGDQARAAGEAIDEARGAQAGAPRGGTPSAGGLARAGSGAAAGAGSGASVAGQVAGQLGQVGSQLGQAATGMFKGQAGGGKSLGLQQVVQPLMQGAQQIVQTAQGHGGHGEAQLASESHEQAADGDNTTGAKAPTEQVTLASDTSPKTGETPA